MKQAVIGAAVIVIIYNLLFFHTGFGFGIGLFYLLLNGSFFLSQNKDAKNISLGLACSFLAVLFASFIGFRANEILAPINFLLSNSFTLAALYFYKSEETFDWHILGFLLTPAKIGLSSVANIFNLSEQPKLEKDATSGLMRGFIIALPILLILYFLLSGADPIFGKIAERFLSNIGERLVISTILFVIIATLGLSRVIFREPKFKINTSNKFHEALVVVSATSLLLFLFLLVQFRYLFASVNELDLKSLGVNAATYSEYVRQGFFQLMVAASIVGLIVVYCLNFLHSLKQKRSLQLMLIVLIAETYLMLGSALQRLILYEMAHGFTRARIFGLIFFIWLALILAILLYRVIREINTTRLFYKTLSVSLLAVLSANLLNVDEMIAKDFVPTVNGEVDYYYLVYLSTDAVSSWKPTIDDAQQTLDKLAQKKDYNTEDNRQLYWRRQSLIQLTSKIDYLNKKYANPSWQTFNLSEYQAYQFVKDNPETFAKLPVLRALSEDLNKKIPEQVRNSTTYDRDVTPPLTN
jgi:hypothetical protein